MWISPFRVRKSWILLAIAGAVFLGLYARYGVVLANDSHTYLAGSVRVSPLYPSLIALLRLIFTERLYLHALVLLQELLAAYAIFSLIAYVGERFSVRMAMRIFLLLAFSGAYFLRLFMVGEEALYSNAILTEGLCYPLYFLFVKYMFAAWDGLNFRHLLTALLLAFLLACARGQLIFLFLVLLLVFILMLRKKDAPKAERRGLWLRAAALGAAYFIGIALSSAAYNYAISGVASQTTMGKEAVFGAVLYNSDAEDAALFEAGSAERAILEAALSEGEAARMTYRAAPSDPIGRFKHYEASHDELRGRLRAAIAELHEGELLNDDALRLVLTGYIDRTLPVLLWDNLGQYLLNCAVNCFGGLVRANSIMNVPGLAWSVIVYALCLACLIWPREPSPGAGGRKRFLKLILVSALSNAMFCAFGVFALSRYVYYNFPCMYLALALCVLPLLTRRRKDVRA